MFRTGFSSLCAWLVMQVKKRSKTGFSVLQWNSRSINMNLLHLQHYLSENKHHIVALQSMNVTKSKLPKLEDYFYPPVTHICDHNSKTYAAIYIRKDVDYKIIQPPVPKDTDGLYCVAVKVKINYMSTLNIVSVYYPRGPDGNNSDWLRTLEHSEKWLIAGDFNAHSPFWDKDCQYVSNNRFVENIVDSGLVLLNDGRITRLPDNPKHKASAIDLTFLSPDLAINCIWDITTDSLGSDHLPIVTVIDELFAKAPEQDDCIPRYMYNRANWVKYHTILTGKDCTINESDSVNDMYSHFTKSLHEAAQNSIPKRKNVNKGNFVGNSWWNQLCEEAKNEKKNV